jgi:hypothetical protein
MPIVAWVSWNCDPKYREAVQGGARKIEQRFARCPIKYSEKKIALHGRREAP